MIDGDPIVNVGHLPGRLTVISDWSHGQETPTKTVEWIIKATGSEPLEVSVEAWAHKAGRDQKTIAIENDSSETNIFTKQVNVFGVYVYATENTPDDKILHAANVLAQYLDNDEDGIPDDQAVLDAMVSRKAAMSMRKGEDDYADNWRRLRRKFLPKGTRPQLLWGDETTLGAIDENGKVLKIDVSWEEILHLVHVNGYAVVYPETFGMRPETEIADAMDLARGGFFEEVPEKYPESAWLAYYDKSCSYGCQIAEYFHWALSSVLGAQDFPGRLEDVKDNWKLTTRELVREYDPAVYALVTDPQFNLPTVLPDGSYSKKKFTIQPFGADTHANDKREQGSSDHFKIEAKPFLKPDFKIIQLGRVNEVLDRKIMVFGIPVFAYEGVSDEDLVRTANVTAQWLDNDEDGTVDNRAVLNELANNNAYVFIVENQEQVNSYNFQNDTRATSLDAESINTDWYSEEGPSGRADGTMEEPFHMIAGGGYGNLYPDVFGTRKGTELSNAMDIARGGQFDRAPDEYPDEAWYSYNDKSCGYGCMSAEYFYWGIISVLGVNDNRGDEISNEWKLYTRELVREKDPRLFELMTNPKYKFPTKYPDGTYGK